MTWAYKTRLTPPRLIEARNVIGHVMSVRLDCRTVQTVSIFSFSFLLQSNVSKFGSSFREGSQKCEML